MFQEALQFKDVIILYYKGKNIVKISWKVQPLLTWHIFQIIMDSLFHVVNACVLTQSNNH